ncbi:TRAP transporter substrate-binding protein [Marinobacter changyiensis]|uniref:TRAP transporter substrate-binding protein n=1 Tax=Marinobacter changyiensis TaxID=2604091 RepID=UPI0012651497|nr:TRAP transporter substrate-binding protein DctP [Marinobacter changyiensis]
MPMTRRALLKNTTLASASFALIGGQSLFAGRASAATKLTGAYYIPPSYEALSYGSNGFIDYLKNQGGDALNVDFYHSGQLVKADEQLPALRAGAIDFMFHTTSYITRSLPILGITGLPGVVDELYRNPERLAKGSPLMTLINAELAKDNIYMLTSGGGILQPEYIWSTAASPIRSLDGVRGKKIRIVSFEATTALKPFNIAAVRISSSETYMALQRGTIDAAVANISTVYGRSLQEQLKVCYELPMTAYTVAPFMLRSRWDALEGDVRQALEGAAQWYEENFASYCNEEIYPNKYWPAVKEAGVEVVLPSDEDLATYRESSQTVWEEWKEQVGKEVGEKAIALALGQV